jgi:tetratricopeptide (TPR) repeat protein
MQFPHGFPPILKLNLDGAIADYNQVIELNPKFANAYNNQGDVEQKKGDLDRAFADNNEAIMLRPNFSAAYDKRGSVKLKKGDLNGAMAAPTGLEDSAGLSPGLNGAKIRRT